MVISFSRLLKEAADYKAKPRQALGDYFFQKLMKLRTLTVQMSEENLVDGVIDGMYRRRKRCRMLSSLKSTDADELYARLRSLGRLSPADASYGTNTYDF